MCQLVSVHLRREEMGVRPGNPFHQPAKTRIYFLFFFLPPYRSRLFSHQFSLREQGPAREVTMSVLYAFLLFVIYSPSLDRKEVCVKVESGLKEERTDKRKWDCTPPTAE